MERQASAKSTLYLLRRSTALAMDDVALDLLKRDSRALCHQFRRRYILSIDARVTDCNGLVTGPQGCSQPSWL